MVGGVLGGVQTAAGSAAEAATYIQQGEPYTQSAEKTKEAIDIGLSAPKGTDARTAAEKLQQQMAKGKKPSAYTLGRMLYESGTPEAVQARAIAKRVQESAEALGVNEKTAEAVSAVAVRTGRTVTFVSPETLQTTGAKDGSQYSIRITPDGTAYVQADESVIPQGATDKDIAAILSDIIKTKFNNLIEVNGQSIGINGITNKEWRWSRNAQHLMQDNEVYTDKMEILNNADEVLRAARSWTNEKPKHNSNRNFINFGRGKITFKVENRGYTADVVVGIKNGGAAYLYDIVNIKSTKINDTSNAGDIGTNADTPRRQDASSDTTIPQNGGGVNTQFMQKGGENAENAKAAKNAATQTGAAGRYTAQGGIELSAALSTEEAVDFVLKHELVHSAEESAGYEKLKRTVRREMGRQAYEEAVEQERENRRRRGDQQGADDPEAEVVADWVGRNLYREGFAQLIRDMDGGMAAKMRAVLDRLQRALGFTQNARQAAAIRTAERAFAKALEAPVSTQENGEGKLAYMNAKSFAENIDEIVRMTDEEALRRKEAGQYITVLEHTPAVILDNVQDAVDRKIIIRFDTAYLATRHDGALQGHYHSYGESIATVLPEVLRHPDAILRMDNGRLNMLAVVPMKRGNNTVVSIELDTIKDINAQYTPYNLVVTMTPAKDNYIQNNLRNHGVAVEYAKDDLPQVNPQLYKWLSIFNGKSSSNDSIPQTQGKSQENSIDGQKSFLPEDIQEREEAAVEKAEKAENPRRLGKSEEAATEPDSADAEENGITKLQRAQMETFSRALELYDAGELSRAELEDTVSQLGREAAEDTDKKWRTGNRGSAQQKEDTKEFRREVRREYAEKAEDKRERAAIRETKTRIGKVKDSLEGLLKSPDKNRHIPTELAQPVRELLDLLRESPADIREQIRIKEAEIRHTPDSRKVERLEKEIRRFSGFFAGMVEIFDEIEYDRKRTKKQKENVV